MIRTAISVAFLITYPALAFALDGGQWGDVDPSTAAWFKSVRSKQGIPCCDMADGHRTQAEKRADNKWWAFVEPAGEAGVWLEVPDDAVIYDAGNPYGEAVIWYRDFGASYRSGPDRFYVRCLVPGSGA